MKIDTNLPVNTVQTEKNPSGPRPSAASSSAVDSDDEGAQLSLRSGLAAALNGGTSTGSTQSSRVDALRQAINNGTYQLNPSGIAEAMMSELM
jgi:flagellar biosynthesis anti-sigma factor FlgM